MRLLPKGRRFRPSLRPHFVESWPRSDRSNFRMTPGNEGLKPALGMRDALVLVDPGGRRGIQAKTQLVFLAVRVEDKK